MGLVDFPGFPVCVEPAARPADRGRHCCSHWADRICARLRRLSLPFHRALHVAAPLGLEARLDGCLSGGSPDGHAGRASPLGLSNTFTRQPRKRPWDLAGHCGQTTEVDQAAGPPPLRGNPDRPGGEAVGPGPPAPLLQSPAGSVFPPQKRVGLLQVGELEGHRIPAQHKARQILAQLNP